MTRQKFILIFLAILIGGSSAIIAFSSAERIGGSQEKRDRCEEMGGVWVRGVDDNVCIDAPTIEVDHG